jgi:hypothetical protein
MQQLSVNGMIECVFAGQKVWACSIQQNWTAGVPVAYNLSALHQYVTGHPPTLSHRAMADVKARITVLFYQIFWQNRGSFSFHLEDRKSRRLLLWELRQLLRKQLMGMTLILVLVTTLKEQTPILGTQQKTTTMSLQLVTSGRKTLNIVHRALPSQLFEEHFTSSSRSRQHQTGLQCSPIDVNTPIRAWRGVFKNVLLDKIVCYNNDYGRAKAKQWQDVKRKDWKRSFASSLFLQSKKGRTNHLIGFCKTFS